MRFKDYFLLGTVLGLLFAGTWYLVGRPAAAERPTASAPANVPSDVAELLARLTPQAQEAYAFALEHPEVLQYMPCYCGCVEGGHTSNLSCFVKPHADGGITLESHASA